MSFHWLAVYRSCKKQIWNVTNWSWHDLTTHPQKLVIESALRLAIKLGVQERGLVHAYIYIYIYKWSQVVGELVNCGSWVLLTFLQKCCHLFVAPVYSSNPSIASSSLDHRLDSPVRGAKGVLQQANMSAQRWLNKFKHVHWSTTGKAYVSCLLNIQNLLFCRRDAWEATKRGHKTGSALVVPLASLVLVSAVDDEWHWGDDKFSQRRYM